MSRARLATAPALPKDGRGLTRSPPAERRTQGAILELTGRTVTAMLSANHIDPDLAAEVYVLDGVPDYDARGWEPTPSAPATDGPAS